MGIRANNLGNRKEISWGHIGKRKNYVNEAWKNILEDREKQKFQSVEDLIKDKIKPWNSNDKDYYWIMMPEKPAIPPTTTTTTTVQFAVWNEVSALWNNETQNWENI